MSASGCPRNAVPAYAWAQSSITATLRLRARAMAVSMSTRAPNRWASTRAQVCGPTRRSRLPSSHRVVNGSMSSATGLKPCKAAMRGMSGTVSAEKTISAPGGQRCARRNRSKAERTVRQASAPAGGPGAVAVRHHSCSRSASRSRFGVDRQPARANSQSRQAKSNPLHGYSATQPVLGGRPHGANRVAQRPAWGEM